MQRKSKLKFFNFFIFEFQFFFLSYWIVRIVTHSEMDKENKKKKENGEDIFEMTKSQSKKSRLVVVESSESSSGKADGMIHDSQIIKKKKLFKKIVSKSK